MKMDIKSRKVFKFSPCCSVISVFSVFKNNDFGQAPWVQRWQKDRKDNEVLYLKDNEKNQMSNTTPCASGSLAE